MRQVSVKIEIAYVIQNQKMAHEIWLGHPKPLHSKWIDSSDAKDLGHPRHTYAQSSNENIKLNAQELSIWHTSDGVCSDRETGWVDQGWYESAKGDDKDTVEKPA